MGIRWIGLTAADPARAVARSYLDPPVGRNARPYEFAGAGSKSHAKRQNGDHVTVRDSRAIATAWRQERLQRRGDRCASPRPSRVGSRIPWKPELPPSLDCLRAS
jgi:hypothetical protein